MGNIISQNTDYRISGDELMKMDGAIEETRRAIDDHKKCLVETLNEISNNPKSITKAIAKFGVLAVRAQQMSVNFNKRLNLIAYNLAHTPIAKNDNTEK